MTEKNHSNIRRFTGGDGEVMDWLRSNGVEKIRVEWMDMHGIPRGKRVSLNTFDELRHKGVPFAALLFAIDLQARWLRNTRFGEEIGFGDFYAVPDLNSMRLLRHEPNTALCLTNLHWADGRPIAEDPRNLLKSGLDQLKELGFAANAAPEFEFYFLTSDFQLSDTGENAYAMLKRWGFREEEQALIDAASAHVDYEACNYEFGPGQFEITVEYGEAMDIADAGHLFRSTLKETALAMDRRVTFMAKPYTEAAGSSCHLHFSLVNEDGSNAFADEHDPLKISQVCRHFIGGILAHFEELAVVFLPYPNSCKRIAPESFAPISIAWGMDNRVAAVRAINVTPRGTRIELRVPGGDICRISPLRRWLPPVSTASRTRSTPALRLRAISISTRVFPRSRPTGPSCSIILMNPPGFPRLWARISSSFSAESSAWSINGLLVPWSRKNATS